MPTWIGFLRAVNVGARPFPMAHLRELLDEAGCRDVATHIQTGNVRLTTSTRSRAKVEAELEALFERDRGFAVPTIVFTPAELAQLAADVDDIVAEHGAPEHGHYVELLRSAPRPEDVELIERQPEGQRAFVRGRAVHLLFDIPYHQAKGANAAAKRALGDSTNRNAKVIRALATKWSAV